MPTEEQIQYDAFMGMSGDPGDDSRGAQRLTISSRIVSKLSFPVTKINNPTGDITLTIRKVSDDGILLSKVWGDASLIPTSHPTATWIEVTFDTPLTIDDLVRICLEFSGGDISVNQVALAAQGSDVKASEYRSYYRNGVWVSATGDDQAYIYTYTLPTAYTQAHIIG